MKIAKTKPTFEEEQKLWNKGYNFVVGVDEVGRGAFAGPVTVGAVVFDKDTPYPRSILKEINDSKLVMPRQRRKLNIEIKKHAVYWSVASIGVSKINKVGIGKATQMAFRKALRQVSKFDKERHFVLIDGFHIRYIRGIGLKNQKAIIKGDRKSITIAAASIIAKVHRDNLMRKLHNRFPNYNFSKNKGYGTKKHQEAIKNYGLSKIHRKSFNLSKFSFTT